MREARILGHRGYSARNPENTARSFRAALEAGADGIECDIQKTRDGRYVILHDETVDRTSNGKGRVADLTFEAARKLDFGQGERIVELEELLRLIPPDRWINLEIKEETVSSADCERIAERLAREGRTKRVLVSSFDHALLRVFRRRRFETGALIGEEHGKKGLRGLLAIAIQHRPTYINLPVQAFERLAPRVVRMLLRVFRLLGCRIIFWTVNTREQFASVRGLCEFIITDEVEKIREWQSRESGATAPARARAAR